jgi:Kef-type K+ transport system membrane component KefB
MDAWLACLAIIIVATVAKLGATTLAARVAGSGWREATTLGVLMNVRGLMVLMVLATTVMAVPALRLLQPREAR